jgi:rod shape determining protein RodA
MFLIDRRYVRSFDWLSFFILIALCSIGLLFVYSATYKPEQPYSIFFKKQLSGILSGFIIYLFFCAKDYRSLMRFGYFAYFAIMGLLIFTLIKGHVGMGGKRWIDLLFFKFQPAELTKLFFPAFTAYYLYTQNESGTYRFKDFIPILMILGLSFLIILPQPDLGTALILAFSGLILLWLTGIGRRFFIALFCISIIIAPLAWQVLKPYQKQRIFVFLGYGESQKERYQIEQSTIAIGSGGLTGKGYMQGTQNRLQFLPERRTDFIFSVIAEEIGFFGTCTIIFLYMLLFFRLLFVIATIKEPFTQLLALGLVIHIALSTIINVGMVLSLLPVVGIPLPLISYGLSNLWVTFASLGWLNGIAMRRFYMGRD